MRSVPFRFRFKEEYAGVVSQIPIAGLIDPIVIRMSSETAVVGDECAYFDTENWAPWPRVTASFKPKHWAGPGRERAWLIRSG